MNDNSEKTAFMQEAIDLAYRSISEGGGPFGCVVVKENKIVGRGFNQVTSTNDPTAHAEVVAIRDACRNLSDFQLNGCDIYTSCEPCPMCLGAIFWARPRKVFFAASRHDAANAGFDDAFIYEEFNREHHLRQIPSEQLLVPDSPGVFEAWTNLQSRINY
jgi:guanine deaminase